jgi:hypothetical protein
MKAVRALTAMASFAAMLLITYYVHIAFFKVDVVFYAAIADGIIATILTGTVLFVLSYFSILSAFERVLLIVICFLAGYCFAISVPTVIDRSLSFYILEKLQQRGGGLRLDGFEDLFAKDYMKEHHLIDVRLTEQQQSGTITIQGGCVRLTARGALIASASRFFRKHFLPKQRLLREQYTDVLTDPFKNSSDTNAKTCR